MKSPTFKPVNGTTSIYVPVALVLAVLTVSIYVIKLVRSPLRSVPGPFLARFTRFWYLQQVRAGNFEKVNIELHRKYGPIVRIAPEQYSIDDADAIKTIYGHGTGFTKGPWYIASENTQATISDLFTDRDPKRHAANRKAVASLYSMTSLLSMETQVKTCVDLLAERLRGLSRSQTEFNLQAWLQYFAFDTIGLVTVNKRFGFLDSGNDESGLIAALHNYLVYSSRVGVYHEWHKTLSWLNSVGLSPMAGFLYMAQFVMEQIENGKKQLEDHKASGTGNDFLTKMLKMNKEQPEKFLIDNIFTTCATNIGAGSDTTSISLAGILYNLIRSPTCLQKLQAEIDNTLEQEGASGDLTFAQAQKLPYLQACIKEGLRMHPATGLPLMRVVPSGGAVIAGRFFPPGAVVGVNTWVAHRNQGIWGHDADIFRPERWLESPEKSSKMEKCFLSFGAGSRTCIGKNISLMEISIVVPKLIREFNFSLAAPERPLETENIWFVKQKNLDCYVKIREKGV